MRVYFLQSHAVMEENGGAGARMVYNARSTYDLDDELAAAMVAAGIAEAEVVHELRVASEVAVDASAPVASQDAVMRPAHARPERASDPQRGACHPAMSKKKFEVASCQLPEKQSAVEGKEGE